MCCHEMTTGDLNVHEVFSSVGLPLPGELPQGTEWGDPQVIGSFDDPHTGQHVAVRAKRGEAPHDAMTRVRRAHNAP